MDESVADTASAERHEPGDLTALIARAREGDRAALDALFEALYPDLRRIAHGRLQRNARDAMLGTTVLVNECYVRLCKTHRLAASDRGHFLAYAAAAMRSIVVDIARAQRAERRGHGAEHVPLDDEIAASVEQPEDEILDVHAALDELSALDGRLARVVEMRYFGGMTDEEIAVCLGLTDRTVRRDWQKARLLLAAAIRD